MQSSHLLALTLLIGILPLTWSFMRVLHTAASELQEVSAASHMCCGHMLFLDQ